MLKRWWILRHDPVRVIRMPGGYPVSGVGPEADLEMVAREDYDKVLQQNETLRQRLKAVQMLNDELHWRIYGRGGVA